MIRYYESGLVFEFIPPLDGDAPVLGIGAPTLLEAVAEQHASDLRIDPARALEIVPRVIKSFEEAKEKGEIDDKQHLQSVIDFFEVLTQREVRVFEVSDRNSIVE